jgi:hypothetical protein
MDYGGLPSGVEMRQAAEETWPVRLVSPSCSSPALHTRGWIREALSSQGQSGSIPGSASQLTPEGTCVSSLVGWWVSPEST